MRLLLFLLVIVFVCSCFITGFAYLGAYLLGVT
ncbi:hypothetical protein ES708_02276 [subsurface metagenome]